MGSSTPLYGAMVACLSVPTSLLWIASHFLLRSSTVETAALTRSMPLSTKPLVHARSSDSSSPSRLQMMLRSAIDSSCAESDFKVRF